MSNYTDLNGLPQNTIKEIYEDDFGFIWLATENGLVRYDGSHFDAFGTSEFPILESNRVSSILSGISSKSVYATFESGERLKISKGRVYPADSEDIRRLSTAIGYISSQQSANMAALIHSGIDFLTSESKWIGKFVLSLGSPGSFVVYEDRHLHFYKNWKKEASCVYERSLDDRLYILDSRLFLTEADGKLSVFDWDERVKRVVKREVVITGDIRVFLQNERQKVRPHFYWNTMEKAVYLRINKQLYAVRFDGNSLRTKLVIADFDFEKSQILSVHFSRRTNTFFLGSTIHGLFVLKSRQFETANPGDNGKEAVYAQAVFDSLHLFLPTGEMIPIRQEGKSGNRKMAESLFPKDGRVDLFNMVQVSPGVAWIDRNNKIYKQDFKTGKSLDSIQLDTRINRFGTLDDDHLWVYCEGGAFFIVNIKATVLKPLPVFRANLRFGNVNQAVRASGDEIWLGCSKGLFRLNLRSKKIRLINGTDGYFIRHLHLSESGSELWIMTYNQGFSLLRNGKLTRFPLDKKQHLTASHCFVEDKTGGAWIPTNKGLFHIQKKELLEYAQGTRTEISYDYFDHNDGLETNEFNGGCIPCSVKLPGGDIVLPTLAGLMYYRPEEVILPGTPGEILLDRVIVNQQTRLLYGDTVVLAPGENSLTIPVRTAFFGNAYNLNLFYAFMPKGAEPVDNDWLALGEQNEINFSYLDKGDYVLYIRQPEGMTRKLLLVLPPKWYQTAWMQWVYILAAAGLVFLWVSYRIRVVSRRNQKLQETVASRTHELTVSLEQLRETSKILESQTNVQNRLITSLVHDTRMPLGSLKYIAEKNQKMLDGQADSSLSENNRLIIDSTTQILGIMEDTLLFIKTNVLKRAVKVETILLRDLLQKNIEICLIHKNDNRVDNRVTAQMRVSTVPKILNIILYNLLDNANKNSRSGTINISTENESDHAIELVIQNSGRAFPKDIAEWLSNDSAGQPDWFNGVGLLLVKELVKMIGISIRIEILENTTRAILAIPKKLEDRIPI